MNYDIKLIKFPWKRTRNELSIIQNSVISIYMSQKEEAYLMKLAAHIGPWKVRNTLNVAGKKL